MDRPPDGGLRGAGSRQRAVPTGERPPIFFFEYIKKKMRRARWKRKGRLGALRCSGPPRATGVSESVPTKPVSLLPVRAGRLCCIGSVPRARCGVNFGVVIALNCFSFRCRSRLREEPGSAQRSGTRGKRSWSNAILQPVDRRTRTAGISVQACTAPRRAREKIIVNPQAPSHANPRTATLHLWCKVATKSVFSLWTVHGPFLFWQDKREMGGCIPLDKPPAGTDTPAAAVRRPYRSRQTSSSSDRS